MLRTLFPKKSTPMEVYKSSFVLIKKICLAELTKESKWSSNEEKEMVLSLLNNLYNKVEIINKIHTQKVEENKELLFKMGASEEFIFSNVHTSEMESKINDGQKMMAAVFETSLGSLYIAITETIEKIQDRQNTEQHNKILNKLSKISNDINQMVPGICYSSFNKKHKRSAAQFLESTTYQGGISIVSTFK
ncbi:MAG: hypothetical protein JO131_08465 [Gammaproteobacteria bacterium]|nr:hypothetical protein [Gammaproteobacteria bacterium]